MAAGKARAVAAASQPNDLVIGSDTIVVDLDPATPGSPPGGEVLGKPVDEQDATRMLNRLRGRTHQVITAVAVFQPSDDLLLTDRCITGVKMRSDTQDEIRAYVASGDPLDKAGAYAIQHAGFDPVERIQGCFANVVGLPLCIVNRLLAGFGLEPALQIPRACDHASCPFCQTLMRGGI